MKTMCPPGCHHNGFVVTCAFGHMMYGCAGKRVLSKLGKERITSSHKRCKVPKSGRFKTNIIYMKSLKHMPKYMSCHKTILVIFGRPHLGHINILVGWKINPIYVLNEK